MECISMLKVNIVILEFTKIFLVEFLLQTVVEVAAIATITTTFKVGELLC